MTLKVGLQYNMAELSPQKTDWNGWYIKHIFFTSIEWTWCKALGKVEHHEKQLASIEQNVLSPVSCSYLTQPSQQLQRTTNKKEELL